MIRLSSDVRAVVSSDGAVVLDVQRGKMFRTNQMGSKILELLIQGCSEERIVREISGLCNVPTGAIASDVGEFLASIEQQGLVHTDGLPGRKQGIPK